MSSTPTNYQTSAKSCRHFQTKPQSRNEKFWSAAFPSLHGCMLCVSQYQWAELPRESTVCCNLHRCARGRASCLLLLPLRRKSHLKPFNMPLTFCQNSLLIWQHHRDCNYGFIEKSNNGKIERGKTSWLISWCTWRYRPLEESVHIEGVWSGCDILLYQSVSQTVAISMHAEVSPIEIRTRLRILVRGSRDSFLGGACYAACNNTASWSTICGLV